MDKLLAMEVFVRVVDTGGFTRAAEGLKMPKATVTTLIQNLEANLRVKLLNRTTRQVSVTSDGAAYYERCAAILAEVRDAEEALSSNQTRPHGRLRIDVPSGLGRLVIMPALPEFFARYPDIHLDVGSSDRIVDLVEEGVDCVVRGGDLPDSSLVARRVGAMHLITCASPAYLARAGRPAHPRDLLRHQCVNYFAARTGKVYDWDFVKDGERIELATTGPIAVSDGDTYVAAGLAGLGIVRVPGFVLREYMQHGELEPVLSEWLSEPIPLHVVYPHNRHLSTKVRVFVEWIAELFAHHDGMQMRSSVSF